MIQWLDSAYPPNDAQIAAAKAAGYGGWAGYFTGTFILNGWSQADFDRVKAGGLRTMAYCSGWSDPATEKAQSAAWAVTICLDVEGGIRGNGSWVQPWLDASGAGLYGNDPVHGGRSAPFHVLAAYPTSGDPGGMDWSVAYVRPVGLCGWQWAGSHGFAGITVDSSWFDDSIALLGFGPGGGSLGDDEMTPEEHGWLKGVAEILGSAPRGPRDLDDLIATLYWGADAGPNRGAPAAGAVIVPWLADLRTRIAAISTGAPTDLTQVLAAIADLRAHPAVVADPSLAQAVDALSKHLGIGTA